MFHVRKEKERRKDKRKKKKKMVLSFAWCMQCEFLYLICYHLVDYAVNFSQQAPYLCICLQGFLFTYGSLAIANYLKDQQESLQ